MCLRVKNRTLSAGTVWNPGFRAACGRWFADATIAIRLLLGTPVVASPKDGGPAPPPTPATCWPGTALTPSTAEVAVTVREPRADSDRPRHIVTLPAPSWTQPPAGAGAGGHTDGPAWSRPEPSATSGRRGRDWSLCRCQGCGGTAGSRRITGSPQDGDMTHIVVQMSWGRFYTSWGRFYTSVIQNASDYRERSVEGQLLHILACLKDFVLVNLFSFYVNLLQTIKTHRGSCSEEEKNYPVSSDVAELRIKCSLRQAVLRPCWGRDPPITPARGPLRDETRPRAF